MVHQHKGRRNILDEIRSEATHIPAMERGLIDLPEKSDDENDVAYVLHTRRDAGRVDPLDGPRQKLLEQIQLRRVEERKSSRAEIESRTEHW